MQGQCKAQSVFRPRGFFGENQIGFILERIVRYFITLNPCKGFKADSLAVDSHVEASLELLDAIRKKRKAFVEIMLDGGRYQEVGRTIPPHDKGKPWTHSLMPPDLIRGFYPTVQLLGAA